MLEMATVTLDGVCKPHAQNDSGNFLVGIVNGCFSEITDLMCGKYPDIQKCQELEPEITKDIIGKIDNISLRSNDTIMVTLIQVLQKMDESIES